MSHKNQDKQISKYGGHYINSFVQSKCAPDLLINNLFPNVKEITESWAMFEATSHLDDGFEWNSDVNVVVVGDGIKPRTGAMFAFRTKWVAHSVDPALRPTVWNIDRLSTHRKKIEEVKLHFETPLLIVLCHSHAPIKSCLDNLTGKTRAIISMDCCVNQMLNTKPDVEYVDMQVWSPKNTVRVWRNV